MTCVPEYSKAANPGVYKEFTCTPKFTCVLPMVTHFSCLVKGCNSRNFIKFFNNVEKLLTVIYLSCCCSEMAPRKGKEKKEEQVISLGPQVAEGENVFGVYHIFASFNDTFVHVTDLSGK